MGFSGCESSPPAPRATGTAAASPCLVGTKKRADPFGLARLLPGKTEGTYSTTSRRATAPTRTVYTPGCSVCSEISAVR